MPMSPNSPKVQPKKRPAKKQWKAALSRPSATSPSKQSTSPSKRIRLDSTLALKLLKQHYPDAHCALNFESPFQLLVATILSAQCTDERVNIVTKELFKEYPDAKTMAKAPVADLERLVRSTGFYKNKAKNLQHCAKALVEDYHGVVPQELEQLTALAGVGRKTANVVLGNAYGITSGIVVDTHVTRLSNRFGWTKSENAVVIEKELMPIIPVEDWILISHLLISHGRAVCKARRPQCESCFLADPCPQKL
jgi:endonuclease-3